MPTLNRRLAAIVIADVVGYTRLMEADETETMTRLRTLRTELIDPMVVSNRGRIVKSTGDGILAEFASVTQAVQCCVDIQLANTDAERDLPADQRIALRIGVNLGEIITDGDDIFGTGVNLAARLETLCQPGELCISATVYDQVHGIMDLSFRDMGQSHVKNLVEPVHSFAVLPNGGDHGKIAETTTTPRKHKRPLLAVLPFKNLNDDKEQEYFADGLTEDLIAALSKNRWFLVAARNATFVYKGQPAAVKQIASDLGADFVLEGSLRQAGSRVRISAQLIDVDNATTVWAERYDREMTDIFDVQDEITGVIAARIEPEIGAVARSQVQRDQRRDLNVWQTYHLASSHVYRYTKDENARALSLYHQVIKEAPDFAAAYAGVAYGMFLRQVYFGGSSNDGEPQAMLEFANRAVVLDDKDANSYFIRGRVRLIRREYDLSISDLRMAIDLNPCMATAYCGLADSLSYSGRMAEAIPHFEEAIRLSPHDPRKWAFLVYGSLALMLQERFDDAVAWATDATAVANATFWAPAQLTAALIRAGQTKKAKVVVAGLLDSEPDFSAQRFARQFLFYHEDAGQMAAYRDTLVAAGLPA